MDILNPKDIGEFDFIFGHGFLHNLPPDLRAKAVENISKMLKKGGKYLSICFNEKSQEFGGPGRGERSTGMGHMLFYSSFEELEKLFSEYFTILEAKLINFGGERPGSIPHITNYFFMEK